MNNDISFAREANIGFKNRLTILSLNWLFQYILLYLETSKSLFITKAQTTVGIERSSKVNRVMLLTDFYPKNEALCFSFFLFTKQCDLKLIRK